MIIDPIVQEVRDIREKNARLHNFNFEQIVSDIKRNERKLIEDGWKLQEIVVNKSIIPRTARPPRP